MDAQTIAAGRRDARPPRARVPGLRDEALGRLASTGSERAFAVLYERYHALLYRYCRSIVRHDADAQDALQATFVAAYGALRAGRRDAPLRPWLFRIAHNESITVLRQRRVRDEVPEDLPAAGAEVETLADNRQRLRQLLDDLGALPERQRSALTMRELSGLSHEEIAVALGSSVAAAKQTIFEARRTLTEYAAGRAMSCDEICRMISDGDRRAVRSRKVRAHVRQCASCSAFAEAIPARAADLRALAPPMAPAAAAAILARATGGAGHAGGGYGAAASGVGAKAVVAATAAKVATGVAVLSATLGAAAIVAAERPASIRDSHAGSGAAAPHGGAAQRTGAAVEPRRGSAVARSALARWQLGPAHHGAAIGRGGAAALRHPSTPKVGRAGAASRAAVPGTTASGAARRGSGGSVTTAPGQSQPSVSYGQPGGGQSSGYSQSASAPGWSSSSPGQSASAPGHSGSAPGQSGSAPGRSGTAPGQSRTAGQSSAAPSQSRSAPGPSGSAPGLSGSAPGLAGSAPGVPGDAPGVSGTTPDVSGSAPGQAARAGRQGVRRLGPGQ